MGLKVLEWDDAKYASLLPKIDDEASKYSRGSVAVLGGSQRFTGAPILSALASARAGAGYTTLIAPCDMELVARMHLLSIPVVGAPSHDGTFLADSSDVAAKTLRHLDAVVLGPGMDVNMQTAGFCENVLRAYDAPIVADADGLNAIAGRHLGADPSKWGGCENTVMDALMQRAERGAKTVLTPHDGELKRLVRAVEHVGFELPETVAAEYRDYSERACNAQFVAAATGAVVVAKGHETLIVADGVVLSSRHATSALAKSGTGDVLSGIIGALLAQGLDAFDAAALGVRIHGEAGVAAEAELGRASVVAEDVVESIPQAIMTLES